MFLVSQIVCFGWAWGPEALRAFSQVATRLAIHGNTSQSKVVTELHVYARLSLL